MNQVSCIDFYISILMEGNWLCINNEFCWTNFREEFSRMLKLFLFAGAIFQSLFLTLSSRLFPIKLSFIELCFKSLSSCLVFSPMMMDFKFRICRSFSSISLRYSSSFWIHSFLKFSSNFPTFSWTVFRWCSLFRPSSKDP